MTDWADRPGEDFGKEVDIKGPERQHWAFRGTFPTLEEAVAIAATSRGPRYVAHAPYGGFSIFRMSEVPCGHIEGDSAELWPLEDVVVFLPPEYAPEPATGAVASRRIGSRG